MFHIHNHIILDIETLPNYRSFEQMPDRWQQLWIKKIERSLPENVTAAEFYGMRAGVMAEFSKIVCISLGYYYRDINLHFRIKSFYGHDEKVILEKFLELLNRMEIVNNKWQFTGHNIKEFDIPFICRRLLVNGLPVPPYLDFQNMKPWETNIVDTFQYWRFGDYKNFTSLDLLAATLGLPTPKSEMDGSMVADAYYNDEYGLQKIAKYCSQDVATVANILLRFSNIPPLHPDDIEYLNG